MGEVSVPLIDVLRTFSASLPAIFGIPSRPWNGRALTEEECRAARDAFRAELRSSGSLWFAAQAAYEVLSAEAR